MGKPPKSLQEQKATKCTETQLLGPGLRALLISFWLLLTPLFALAQSLETLPNAKIENGLDRQFQGRSRFA